MDKILLESLFWLLLLLTINSTETSLWNYNIIGVRNLTNFEAQNTYEMIVEFTISLYSFYILFFINKGKSKLINIILLIFGISYFMDGLSSLLILSDRENPYYKQLYSIMFTTEFFLEIGQSFLSLFLLYNLLFV